MWEYFDLNERTERGKRGTVDLNRIEPVSALILTDTNMDEIGTIVLDEPGMSEEEMVRRVKETLNRSRTIEREIKIAGLSPIGNGHSSSEEGISIEKAKVLIERVKKINEELEKKQELMREGVHITSQDDGLVDHKGGAYWPQKAMRLWSQTETTKKPEIPKPKPIKERKAEKPKLTEEKKEADRPKTSGDLPPQQPQAAPSSTPSHPPPPQSLEENGSEKMSIGMQLAMYLGLVTGILGSSLATQYQSGGDFNISITIVGLLASFFIAIMIVPQVYEKLHLRPDFGVNPCE